MIQSKTINSIGNYFLYIAAFAFVLCYLVLSYYNRPTCDDFGNIFYAKDKSLFEYVKLFYDTYGGRWARWGYIYIVFAGRDNFQDIPIYVFIYYTVTLLVFIYSIKEIIKIGTEKLFHVVLDNKTTITFSVLFLACFYFFTLNNIEAWWYICASFHYLQGIMFLLLGVALLLRENIKAIHYSLIVISFAYVGSGFEMYALMVAAHLAIYFAYLYFKKKNVPLKGLIVASVSLLASSAITFLGPGNFIRRKYFEENFTTYIDPITWQRILGFLLQKKFIIAIIIAFVFLVLGMKIKNNSTVLANKKRINNVFIFSIVSFILSLIIIYLVSELFTFGIMPPARAWTFSSFTFAFFVCFSFLRIGYSFPVTNQSLQSVISFSIALVLMLLMSFNLYNQYKYASNYSKKYDEFINAMLISKNNNQTQPFYMDQLPDSGMLMKLEMTEETSNPTHLKNILGVKFEVIVKE